MRRILIPIIGLLCIMYACSNDLTTIGQDIISNDSYIGEETFDVSRTATVRVDSFVTSSGKYGYVTGPTIDLLVMGRYDDKWSGVTEATPCFQIAPSSVLSFSNNTVLDSVTFNFSYGGSLWGDTLYDAKLQKYHLYQLKEFPDLEDYGENTFFYNTKAVNLDTIIGTTVFFPFVENINTAYFKIDQALGDTLFERMLNRRDREDDIYYNSSSGNLNYHNFLYYFKGLAIVSDPANDCLLTIDALSDSLYLEFHYSVAGTESSLRFPLSQREYQYNRIINKPNENLEPLVESSENEVFFEEIGFSLTQGMCGYMTKLSLPEAPGFGRYATIIKAQLEIKLEFMNDNPVSPPSEIEVYTTNDINEVTGSFFTIKGRLKVDPIDADNNLYLFDMTDYYQLVSSLPPAAEPQQILLSVLNEGFSNKSISFDQMVVREVPVLRVHYAKYK